MIPSLLARSILGERQIVAKIAPGAELIFCRRKSGSGVNGYFVIVRAENGAEETIWDDVTGVTRREWSRTADEIRQRYPFKVRVVTQFTSGNAMTESDWTAESDKIKWFPVSMMMAVGMLPYLGILARALTSNVWILILVGTILWVCLCAVYLYIYRTRDVSEEQPVVMGIFVSSMMFACFYLVAVLVTGGLIQRGYLR